VPTFDPEATIAAVVTQRSRTTRHSTTATTATTTGTVVIDSSAVRPQAAADNAERKARHSRSNAYRFVAARTDYNRVCASRHALGCVLDNTTATTAARSLRGIATAAATDDQNIAISLTVRHQKLA